MKGISIRIVRNTRFRLAVPIVCGPNRHDLDIPIDSYLFQRYQVGFNITCQYNCCSTGRTLNQWRCQSIPIAGHNTLQKVPIDTYHKQQQASYWNRILPIVYWPGTYCPGCAFLYGEYGSKRKYLSRKKKQLRRPLRPFIMRSDSRASDFIFQSEKKTGLLMQSDFAKYDPIKSD